MAITNVLDRRIRFGQTTKNHWLCICRAVGGERCKREFARLVEAVKAMPQFTPAEPQAHPSVAQVNVTRNSFELSPCIGRCAHAPVPGVRAAISHSAVTSRGMTGLRSAVALRADLANAAAKAAS